LISGGNTFTAATAVNSQIDSAYSVERKIGLKQVPKRDVRKREHFSRGIMVSNGVSRMKKTSVVTVESGVKVNSASYCEHFLRRGFLPAKIYHSEAAQVGNNR